MPFSNLMRSAAGTCRYCGNKAGVLTRGHLECRRISDVGWIRMVTLATDAAKTHQFNELDLRLSLAEIARNSYGDGTTVNEALEEGWKRGVSHDMADGIITQAEEAKPRAFRYRAAVYIQSVPTCMSPANLEKFLGTGSRRTYCGNMTMEARETHRIRRPEGLHRKHSP